MGLFSKIKRLLKIRTNQADTSSGWSAGPSYTITVPPGKWTIDQKITVKQNGEHETTYPVITAVPDGVPTTTDPQKNAKKQ